MQSCSQNDTSNNPDRDNTTQGINCTNINSINWNGTDVPYTLSNTRYTKLSFGLSTNITPNDYHFSYDYKDSFTGSIYACEFNVLSLPEVGQTKVYAGNEITQIDVSDKSINPSARYKANIGDVNLNGKLTITRKPDYWIVNIAPAVLYKHQVINGQAGVDLTNSITYSVCNMKINDVTP